MENINVAENAVHGVTDISGVKDTEPLFPDGEVTGVACAADTSKNTAEIAVCSAAGAIETENELTSETEISSDKNGLEVEFEALIEGKYRDVYRRKTESIIRKRLKSGKARPDGSLTAKEATRTDSGEAENASQADVGVQNALRSDAEKSATEKDIRVEMAQRQNKNRPIENGLAGSCGIVTKINVSALDSEGVLSILRRVGSGEKISFK